MSREGRFYLIVAGWLLLIFVASVVALIVSMNAGWFVSFVGTVAYLVGQLAWVVLWDSRKRWPGLSANQRLYRLMSFKR